MAEFQDRQASLDAARKGLRDARRALFVAEEKRRRLQRKGDAPRRRTGDEQTDARLEELERLDEELAQSIETLKGQVDERVRLERDELAAFVPFSDPTENVARLDDRYPILLFPVRLETRFKDVVVDGEPVTQLWVRVYPDDIAVDTFEELLSEVEIENARIYWTNIWKAGGDEGERRAAWRSLAKSHGSGRAYWIIRQFAPTNAADEPVKEAGDYILVVVSDLPLPATEKPAVAAYWRAVWVADNDQAAVDEALAELIGAVGRDRAERINADYVPQNLGKRPADADSVNPRVEFLELPSTDGLDTQQQPWMRGASTALLPERFVLMGFNNGTETLRLIGNPVPSDLAIGPAPTAEPANQIHLEDAELVVPDELRWLVDFDEAVAKGMGFRATLSSARAQTGFDRLFVLGVRLSADVDKSREQLETLLAHHQRSRKGLSILPQGAPTNNVEDADSAYTWREDTEVSYDHYFVQDHADDPDDWRLRKDGRWLAESLGVNPELLKASPSYFATDQCEARAMSAALWPATLGSFMDKSMEPVFADAAITGTRDFFNRYVVGRGTVPAIRVGKQPYGILPATPFTRMNWLRRKDLGTDDRTRMRGPEDFAFLQRLYALILKADETWSELGADVSFVSKPGVNPQQALLDVIGLHPASVEFYQRYAETLEQLYNRYKYSELWGRFIAAIVALGYVASGTELLAELGYDAEKNGIPELLDKFFLQTANLLKGPLIDEPALSETEALRAHREDGSNYLEWLIAAARDSHDTLRKQEGFLDDRPPTALLYLMVHRALDVGYLETSLQLHADAELFSESQVRAARRPPKFIHVQESQEDVGSQWQYLYKTERAITASDTLTIERYIPTILHALNPYLNQQLEALEHLAGVPTARLERAFAEHLDCCAYRLDAWWLALLGVQLEVMRDAVTSEDAERAGTYLGAFGWLEEVRPQERELAPVRLDAELEAVFNKPGDAPLTADTSNFGYIHAPSLNHAVAAAVLRNGYLANATPQNPESLAVNLTSARVRLAMGVIEGVRNGQSLSALLGYQLERGLHDEPGLFLDSLIFELRREFPLAGNRLSTTREEGEDIAIDTIEARNVVDGLALVEHVQAQAPANQSYPFGLGERLPEITDGQQLAAINAQVGRIMDINDAVADLAMAEGVYQMVQGNTERAAGTLEAFSKGNFPPTPEVVQTPRSGVTLTHRIGLQLQGGLDPNAPASATPRAKGEPAIDKWLADYLPAPGDVFVQVEFFDHAAAALRTEDISQSQLGLAPVDLLYMVDMDGDQQMRALDDRILFHVLDTFSPRPDAHVRIHYQRKPPGRFSLFELVPYLKNLRALLLSSRPLRPTDVSLPNEADVSEDATMQVNEAKVTAVRDALTGHVATLAALLGDLNTILGDSDPDVVAANAISNVDRLIADYQNVTDKLVLFGIPAAGVAFAYDWRRQQFAALNGKLDDRINRWHERLDRFDQRLLDYADLDPGTSDEDRFRFLLTAARSISTATLTPLPATPDQLRDALNDTHRDAFVTVLGVLETIRDTRVDLSTLYADIAARESELADHDPEPFELEDNKNAVVAFVRDLQNKTQSLHEQLIGRLAKAGDLLTGDPEAVPAARVEQLTTAVRLLLGEGFVVLPEFAIGERHGREWQNAWDARAQLLRYLKDEQGIDFPVDDWLYGAARVRDKLHHLESAQMLAMALAQQDLDLEPLQFPYRDDDCWLALRFPAQKPGSAEPFTIDEDKLLYTAHHHRDFSSADPLHCGLLLDEWTEVIPTVEETTGLTFHYDRPDSEAPQTLLLALPADFSGAWQWQDLVDTLHETLDMARKRAVEPAHVDGTPYARFLPAVLSEAAVWPITSSLNLAFNNAIQFQSDRQS